MVVGICRLTLSIADSYSLKDKRRVVKSLTERLRHRFNVAVAEVDEHEVWNAAVIGVTCVSTSSTHARDILDHVISFADGHVDAELVDSSVEILPGF
ncbi:MAG TPA: DUF503 domain-containing protein [Chloroflexota bacterium]|nr:DUF503 domain-containing protein [Chloroflexota bacterium]